MKPLVILQARMSSTRLPGKVLRPFREGKTILDVQVQSLKEALPDFTLVLATSANKADDALEEYARKIGVEVYRGSEHDVLQRFIGCAQEFGAKSVVRICSDNPFLMGSYVEQMIHEFENKGLDYLSFKAIDGTPAIKMHWGLFGEVVRVSALEKVNELTNDPFYHEHVTNFIYVNPQQFAVELIPAPNEVFSRKDLRFTIDTSTDMEMAQLLYPVWNKLSLKDLVTKAEQTPGVMQAMKKGIDQFSK